jgi:hypothetical protein
MDVYSKAWLLLWSAGSNPSQGRGFITQERVEEIERLQHGTESILRHSTTPMDQWSTDLNASRHVRQDERAKDQVEALNLPAGVAWWLTG